MIGACASNHKKDPTPAEMSQAVKQQKAEAVVSQVFSAIDNRDWKAFEKNFANQTVFIVNEPLLLKPGQITEHVKPYIEYFTSTQHQLSNFKLEEKEERILGSADFNGNYWRNHTLTSDLASVSGKYEFEFSRNDGELRIMRMRFIQDKVEGEKEMIRKAMGKTPRQDQYRVKIVTFPSKNGKKMRGWLYQPKGNVHDIVILNGNIANVKEQASLAYAQEMGRNGIASMIFDFVNFGESEGSVRNLEDPGQKIDDFRGAVDYIAHRKEYSASRITLAGIGASAGYVSAEAVNDPRVDRVIMIAPWLQNAAIVQDEDLGTQDKLRAARMANHQFIQDKVLTYVPVVSFSDQSAVITSESQGQIDYYLSTERANIPQWQNRFATMGWIPWLNFDSTAAASRIRVPTLIINSLGDNHKVGVEDFTEKMRMKPEVHALSVQPYDLYDRKETISQTVGIIENFLDPSSTNTEVTVK